MNVVDVDHKMITRYAPVAVVLAEAEGLTAHASALKLPSKNNHVGG
jgi:histidinol dehydrogenase